MLFAVLASHIVRIACSRARGSRPVRIARVRVHMGLPANYRPAWGTYTFAGVVIRVGCTLLVRHVHCSCELLCLRKRHLPLTQRDTVANQHAGDLWRRPTSGSICGTPRGNPIRAVSHAGRDGQPGLGLAQSAAERYRTNLRIVETDAPHTTRAPARVAQSICGLRALENRS